MLHIIYFNAVPKVHVLCECKKMQVSTCAYSHVHTLDFIITDILCAIMLKKLTNTGLKYIKESNA
jgi:hypothetical protein